MLIVLIGPPGCGKGTQGKLLSKYLNCIHINVGDLVRNFAKNEPSQETTKLLSEGKLLSDNFINSLTINTIKNLENNSSCVLDGMPRSLNQAIYLTKNLPGKKIIAVYFEISEENLVQRITGRYSCSNCNAVYNKYSMPTKIEGICDKCSGDAFTVRDDDKAQILKTRIKEYQHNSTPLLNYYKEQNSIIIIDSTKEISTIQNQIKGNLEKILLTYNQ